MSAAVAAAEAVVPRSEVTRDPGTPGESAGSSETSTLQKLEIAVAFEEGQREAERETGPSGGGLVRVDPELRALLGSDRRLAGERERDQRRRSRDARAASASPPPTPANKPETFGIFTLFWLGVFLFVVKTLLTNYRLTGSFLRTDILSIMFDTPRLIECLAFDAFIFFGTALWSVPTQRAIFGAAQDGGVLSWDRAGKWVQALWQAAYLGGIFAFTVYRRWAWIQTVFVVLHAIVVLMKMHSWAVCNGALSAAWWRRERLRAKMGVLRQRLARAEVGAASKSASASAYELEGDGEHVVERRVLATEEAKPQMEELGLEEARQLDRLLDDEMATLTEELAARVPGQPPLSYPDNLTYGNYVLYLHFPTLIYELSYPRTPSIRPFRLLTYFLATLGLLCAMLIISQTYLYPLVLHAQHLSHTLPLRARLSYLPWLLLDELFPFTLLYLCTFHLIWASILPFLGEATRFAFSSRSFYGPWWNAANWDAFARDWNAPVHRFLRRHVYRGAMDAWGLNRAAAGVVTFVLSSIVHEVVMAAIFGKLRGYLFVAQMMQVPLVIAGKWVGRWRVWDRVERLTDGQAAKIGGNVFFWIGIYTGPSFLCSIYLLI